jgi:hypothetical protein
VNGLAKSLCCSGFAAIKTVDAGATCSILQQPRTGALPMISVMFGLDLSREIPSPESRLDFGFLMGPHVIDSNGNLVGNFHEKCRVRLDVLIPREAPHRNRADTQPADHERQRAN